MRSWVGSSTYFNLDGICFDGGQREGMKFGIQLGKSPFGRSRDKLIYSSVTQNCVYSTQPTSNDCPSNSISPMLTASATPTPTPFALFICTYMNIASMWGSICEACTLVSTGASNWVGLAGNGE
jgi:hypothetical protein